MSPDLANWLGIAFLFGFGSFFLGWTACNAQWKRWLRSRTEGNASIDRLIERNRAAARQHDG